MANASSIHPHISYFVILILPDGGGAPSPLPTLAVEGALAAWTSGADAFEGPFSAPPVLAAAAASAAAGATARVTMPTMPIPPAFPAAKAMAGCFQIDTICVFA
eukprot:CAMPEP_0172321886 /NCGR_PEP_ID=MMETSP1058-20130122/44556_1 /TAXON_ID=83371 /ORGANISM="Detonula confervacea, Strain CCMP 353" /LENGTH=103 /DNA_ID=CAMNT_0013037497 /DNA_START=445 /DNA_END=752 /DNA_ORIENTATION=-